VQNKELKQRYLIFWCSHALTQRQKTTKIKIELIGKIGLIGNWNPRNLEINCPTHFSFR
jgi:hypothetical protein